MIVWLNGVYQDEADAGIAPTDRGFLLGDGIFETVLAQHGRLILFDAHMARLEGAAHALGIPLPPMGPGLASACAGLLQRNGLANAPRASLRITLTRGSGPRGLLPPEDMYPTLLITAALAGAPPVSQTAIIATGRRNEWSSVANFKSLAYLDNIRARQEAQARGADDAILFNTHGALACASAANVFVWEEERLLTPPVSDGILPGIVRAAVIELARSMHIDAVEQTISLDRLLVAEGAFFTNSLIGIVPVSRLENRAMPAHWLTGRLQAAYELLIDDEE